MKPFVLDTKVEGMQWHFIDTFDASCIIFPGASIDGRPQDCVLPTNYTPSLLTTKNPQFKPQIWIPWLIQGFFFPFVRLDDIFMRSLKEMACTAFLMQFEIYCSVGLYNTLRRAREVLPFVDASSVCALGEILEMAFFSNFECLVEGKGVLFSQSD